MSLSRYPKYKDSGVEWLGQLPTHWTVDRLKRRCEVFPSNVDKKSYEGESPVRLCNYTDVYYNETIVADMELMAATATDDQIAKFTLRAGDTIITKDSETADDIAIAAYVPGDLPGVVCGYHLAMVRPFHDAHGPFVKRLFDAHYAKSCFAVRANGLTRMGLGQHEIENVDFPWPPLPEQVAIAAFLDREAARIDALVAEQKNLIDLLREKRQAVISHAVTKGLNPNVPLKDSCIDWVGSIPQHWEAARNKAVFREVDQRTETDGGELLTVSHITGVTRRSEKDVNMFLAETLEGYKVCARGDLVINTMWAWMGALGCSPHDGLVSPAYNVYRPREPHRLRPDYYDYLCRLPAHAVAMKARSTGVWESRLRLYPDAFLDMWMPLPPPEEQGRIVSHLNEHLCKWDALVTEAERAIGFLQERRSAIISAAVTGRIDVRDGAGRAA